MIALFLKQSNLSQMAIFLARFTKVKCPVLSETDEGESGNVLLIALVAVRIAPVHK